MESDTSWSKFDQLVILLTLLLSLDIWHIVWRKKLKVVAVGCINTIVE